MRGICDDGDIVEDFPGNSYTLDADGFEVDITVADALLEITSVTALVEVHCKTCDAHKKEDDAENDE